MFVHLILIYVVSSVITIRPPLSAGKILMFLLLSEKVLQRFICNLINTCALVGELVLSLKVEASFFLTNFLFSLLNKLLLSTKLSIRPLIFSNATMNMDRSASLPSSSNVWKLNFDPKQTINRTYIGTYIDVTTTTFASQNLIFNRFSFPRKSFSLPLEVRQAWETIPKLNYLH